MRLVVERDYARVTQYLTENPSASWTVIGANVVAPAAWAELEKLFGTRELAGSLSEQEQNSASELASSFFRYAEARDPELRLNFTARVPLSIPDWDEVQTLFRIRAFLEQRSSSTLVVWLADKSYASLLGSAGLVSCQRGLSLWSPKAIFRIVRAAARSVVNCSPQVIPGVRVWFTVGTVLEETARDTYYGSWWRSAPGINVRVFMSPGRAVRLGGDSKQGALESFGTLTDVLVAFVKSITPPKIAGGPHERMNRELWNWLARCEWERGDTFALALQCRIASRLFRHMKSGSIVVPFEGRSWERNVTRLAKNYGISVAGYQHSSLTPRHLALIEPSPGWGPRDYPDRVITCGSVTANRLALLANTTGLRIVKGAALRTQRTTLPSPKLALMVAISSSSGESRAILRLIHRASLSLGLPIIIRPHPAIPIAELYRQYDWPANVRLSGGSSLMEDIGQVGLIAYSSSTVALEGLIHGRLPIFLDIRDVLIGDPIDYGEFKLTATSSESLVSCIRNVESWPQEKLDSMRQLGRRYAEEYLTFPDPHLTETMSSALQ